MKLKYTRIIAILLMAIMIVNILPMSVFAAESEQGMTLSVSSTTALPKDTVEVTIDLENNPGISSLKFDVIYDEALILESIAFNEDFGAYVTTPVPYENPQTLTFISPLADVDIDGEFATLTFSIAADTADNYIADIEISCYEEEVYDANFNIIAVTVENGSIQVIHGIPGDFDGNRKVNTKDAVLLFRHVAGWDVEIFDPVALDVNGDDEVNTKDAVTLFRYVAGWDVEIVRGSKPECDHVEEIDEAVAPTCTTTGLTEGKHCALCKEVLVPQEIVPIVDHEYVDGACSCGATEGKQPTYSEGLAFTLRPDSTYEVSIGTCTDTEIVIPAEYNGLPVTIIPAGAFENCTNVTSVILPDSITFISCNAFFECSSLKNINFPEGLTTIGTNAFSYCRNLRNIDLPDSVTWIGANAFRACMSFTSINIPDGITTIEDYTFGGCSGLVSVEIPSSVTSIGEWAFADCSRLTSIEIPTSVTLIEEEAFYDCSSLTDVYYIGTKAQWNVISISNDNDYLLNAKIHFMLEDNELKASEGLEFVLFDGTYYSVSVGTCTDTKIVIPAIYEGLPVKEIGEKAFYGCTGLTGVEIPDSVTKIGAWAFYGCESLASVEIPEGVTHIATQTFYCCYSLEYVEIPDSVITIGDGAFQDCSSLTNVEIPSSAITIGVSAFQNCKSLTSVEIPDSLTMIDLAAFGNCFSLTSVIIQGIATTIGESAFSNCSSLTDVYYHGTKEQWSSMAIGDYNDYLLDAAIHFAQEVEDSNLLIIPGGSITTDFTVLTTEQLRLNVPANVYLPDNLVENIDTITAVMEIVSGMDFEGNPIYSSDLINVEVMKYSDTGRELGGAWASSSGIAISAGDLIRLDALIHESAHALQFKQSPWAYCIWAMESISNYTTYKTQKYIELHYPELISVVRNGNQTLANMQIDNFEELYKHSMEYWMDNTFEYSVNNNYAIGFALAWFLDEVYGDYTKWITEYEKENPMHLANVNTAMLPNEEQLKAFYLAYGEDVFDKFYSWLKQNESAFACRTIDISGAKKIQFYPTFAYSNITYHINAWDTKILYNDLLIDFSAGKAYMTDYKGRNIDGMAMTITSGCVVEFYDAEGKLLRTETSQGQAMSLEDVSFIKLVGNGAFYSIDIVGFDVKYH